MKFIPNLEDDEINSFMKVIKNFGEIINEENIYISNLDNSLIIKNNIKYNKILKAWINPNVKIKAELLYRLTREGYKISKFHELCDNKSPTLTLFQLDNDTKGGIFTPSSWDTKSETKTDTETFMFNLNKNEKYKKINNDKRSIWCTNDFGPWTVNFGFYKSNQMKKIEHRGIKINIDYMRGSEILSNNSEDTKYFDVEEVEVYQIIEIFN